MPSCLQKLAAAIAIALMTSGPALAAPAAPASCPADPAWLTSKTPPAEVFDNGQSLCNFQQFAWADFLALVQPVNGTIGKSAPGGLLEFETWMTKEGVFQPAVYEPNRDVPFKWGETLPVPAQCRTTTPKGKAARLMKLIRNGGFSDEIQQAGSNTAPLVDQKGNLVHFEQRLNKTQYDYITGCGLYAASCFNSLGSDTGNGNSAPTTIDFPDQSIEIKTSWRVLDPKDPTAKQRYYTVEAFVQPVSSGNHGCATQLLGLVGFHIVHKTPDHPEFIWATFEHEDNAPDCSAVAAKNPTGKPWSFNNPGCDSTTCPTNLYRNPCGAKNLCQPCQGTSCPVSTVSTFACGLDLKQTCQTVGSCPSTSPAQPSSAYCSFCWDPNCKEAAPTQVCRAFPVGFDGKGQIDPSIEQLNKSVHAMLPAKSVWRHYKLVGTLWFGPPTDPVKIVYGTNGKAQNPLEGSVELSNVTMETYNQGIDRACFACHNGSFAKSTDSFPQADFSHLFAGMAIPGKGACQVAPGVQGCPAPFATSVRPTPAAPKK